jgi:hypothetical protein
MTRQRSRCCQMLKILDWQDPNYAYQILRTKHLTSTEVQCYSPNQRGAAEEMGVAPWEFFFCLPCAGGELAVAGAGVGAGDGGDAAEVAGAADGPVLLVVAVDDVVAHQRLLAAVARPVLHGLGAVGALAAGVVDGLLHHRVRHAGLAHAERTLCRRIQKTKTRNG